MTLGLVASSQMSDLESRVVIFKAFDCLAFFHGYLSDSQKILNNTSSTIIAYPEKHRILNKKAKILAKVVSKCFCLALLFVCCSLEKRGKFKICFKFWSSRQKVMPDKTVWDYFRRNFGFFVLNLVLFSMSYHSWAGIVENILRIGQISVPGHFSDGSNFHNWSGSNCMLRSCQYIFQISGQVVSHHSC